ncbi:MAG: hypothetical protein E4H03_04635 [Myxococcales bacterium]|nr:MAG: hypothetical protein E4H03_04635 [Myxococcales bacterium]
MKPASILTAALVSLTVTTAPAVAGGTKFQTNIVPANSELTIEINPTLSEKGQVKITGKGVFQAKLDGVTDAAGALVTTDGSYNDKTAPTLTGDEYMVVIGGTFVALGVDFRFDLPIELKGGKGKAKIDAASLFTLIRPEVLRTTQQTTINVFGPIGVDAVAGCLTILDRTPETKGGFTVDPEPNLCEAGIRIGVGGIELAP